MKKLLLKPFRAAWCWIQHTARLVTLVRYASEQHDLICNATNTGKDYIDDGCTAYEAVCVLMHKRDIAISYLETLKDDQAKEVLRILKGHQDSEDFSIIPLYM